MKRIVVSLLALGLAATAATAATAADLPARKYAPVAPVAIAPVFTWTGFYVGVNAGYASALPKLSGVGWGRDAHGIYEAVTPDEKKFKTWSRSQNGGFTGGGQIGYNYQIGLVVLGAEADLNYANLMSRSRASSPEVPVGNLGRTTGDQVSARTTLNWFGTVRARIGIVPTERLMAYATGGLAYGSVETKARYTDTVDGVTDWNFGGKKTSTRVGWTVGGGLEYALTDNLTLKGEYNYVNLGSKSNKIYGTGGFDKYYVGAKDKMNFHVVRVGLNYKF